MFVVYLEESDWDFHRKDIIGYAKSEDEIKKFESQFKEIGQVTERLNDAYRNKISILNENTDLFPKPEEPVFKDKPSLPEGRNLTIEEQEERRKINEQNKNLWNEYSTKNNKRNLKIWELAEKQVIEENKDIKNQLALKVFMKYPNAYNLDFYNKNLEVNYEKLSELTDIKSFVHKNYLEE